MGINEVSPDSSDAFLHTIRTRCSWINQPPVCLTNEMGNAVAKMNHYALSAELSQKELKIIP